MSDSGSRPGQGRTEMTGDVSGLRDDGATYVAEPTRAYSGSPRTTGSGVNIGHNVLEVKNRVQWGPILAGVLTALGTLLILSILGLAIGTSVLEPDTDASDWGTAAGIWGAISAIVAFFLGGWVAAKTAAVDGPFAGLMNGLIAGLATLILLIWLTTTGVTNFLGFLGNNAANIAELAPGTVQEAAPADAQEAQTTVDDAATQVQDTARAAYDDVRNGAWGTLIAILLALGAAALGGRLGANERRELIAGSGATG